MPPRTFTLLILLATASCGGATPAPDAPEPGPKPEPGARPAGPIVLPGAPGEDGRAFDADELSELGGGRHTAADVRFMRGMISHHAQALEMTALVRARATTEAVRRMALRMEISQRDEIGLMARWLRDRDEDVPPWKADMARGTARAMTSDGKALMPGMLTPDQMAELRAARGVEFDRRFLELMIMHHEGAIAMVRSLHASPGGGQEAEIFRFASHVDADQTAEIARMRRVLDTLR